MNIQYTPDVVGESLSPAIPPSKSLINIEIPDSSEFLIFAEDENFESIVSSDSYDVLSSIDSSLWAIESLMLVLIVCILIFFTSRVLSIFFKNI